MDGQIGGLDVWIVVMESLLTAFHSCVSTYKCVYDARWVDVCQGRQTKKQAKWKCASCIPLDIPESSLRNNAS